MKDKTGDKMTSAMKRRLKEKMKGKPAGAKTGKAVEDSVVEIGKEMGIFKKDGGPVGYSIDGIAQRGKTRAISG